MESKNYYRLTVKKENFQEVVTYLMFKHQHNSVLIVPAALGNEANYVQRAMWIGEPVELNMNYLKDEDRALNVVITQRQESQSRRSNPFVTNQ